MKNVFIVGGGASGLMAAYIAAKNGASVTLIEKNEKLGKKIYITGKGRCNLTNDVLPAEFLNNVVNNAKFLTGAVYGFTPQNTIDFFEQYGLNLKIERGGRVFPLSDHASDVTKTLEKACRSVGVDIHLNEKALSFEVLDSTMSDIITDKSRYKCDSLIVCTGGISYPSTGSTGDGYKLAKKVGHSVVAPRPALCGIDVKDKFIASLQGVSLKNVTVSAYIEDKLIASQFGEMLFTHFGVSGPTILSLSSQINRLEVGKISLYIDFKPALDEDTLSKRVLRDFDLYKNKSIFNGLKDLLPQKLILPLLDYCDIDLNKPVNTITKLERAKIVSALKRFKLNCANLRGFEEAIVTSGGVNCTEVNPKTMESKLVKGLYFCGEVLDVDAFTGGYNLQIAFSTGYAAGLAVSQD